MYINLKVKFMPKKWERNFSAKEAEAVNRFTEVLNFLKQTVCFLER